MPTPTLTRPRLATAAVAAAAFAMPLLGLATPSQAATNDRGLFGAQDPTYDGAYRQGLAITGLAAADRDIPRAAVNWLRRQQCGNGSFVSYRQDPATPCPKPDPASFTGPDSNSTAFGAMALWVAGERGAARRAARYLRTLRNADGGFAYYRGGASDANSTGLALAALRTVPVKGAKQARTAGRQYLRSVQFRCSASPADRGLLSYQRTPKTPNLLASAQGTFGLVTAFPPSASGKGRTTPPLRCSGQERRSTSVRDAALDALQHALRRGGGLLPNQFGGGADYSTTAQALIALAAGTTKGKAVVTRSTKALKESATTYTGSKTATPNAGALGTLLNVTAVTGTNPKRFGGVNLGRELLGTMRRSRG